MAGREELGEAVLGKGRLALDVRGLAEADLEEVAGLDKGTDAVLVGGDEDLRLGLSRCRFRLPPRKRATLSTGDGGPETAAKELARDLRRAVLLRGLQSGD